MRELKDIVRIALITLLVVAASSYNAEVSARDYTPTNAKSSDPRGSEQDSDHVGLSSLASELSLASESPQMPSLNSLCKTIQRVHGNTTPKHLNISVIRSVKSATHASRYGLCNHKILFSMYARHYYLNGLHRLII